MGENKNTFIFASFCTENLGGLKGDWRGRMMSYARRRTGRPLSIFYDGFELEAVLDILHIQTLDASE